MKQTDPPCEKKILQGVLVLFSGGPPKEGGGVRKKCTRITSPLFLDPASALNTVRRWKKVKCCRGGFGQFRGIGLQQKSCHAEGESRRLPHHWDPHKLGYPVVRDPNPCLVEPAGGPRDDQGRGKSPTAPPPPRGGP